MPTYYARGISAHLGELPLADTVTRDIVLRKGKAAKQQCEAAEERLQESKRLIEERVVFPGDEAGFHLNWLGNAPFMQVQANRDCVRLKDKQDPLPTAQSATAEPAHGCGRTDETDDDDKPRALVLHIHLSGKSFVSGLTHYKTHLKVDVFFNGQLSSCLLLPTYEVRSGMKPIHRVFAGSRVDYLAERPWVILPPDVDIDGNVRKAGGSSSAQLRWQRICQTLQEEADERSKDMNGTMPPSAQFLDALAKMQMPAQVRGLQKPGGRQFGVIDVVISAGDGRKLTSGKSYLKAPQRLAAENFPLIVGSDRVTKQSRVPRIERDDNEPEARERAEPSPDLIDVNVEGDDDSDCEPPPKKQALAPHILSRQYTPDTSFPLLSSNPSMLPPTQSTPKSSPSPTRKYGHHTTPFAMPPSLGHIRSSSPESRRGHDEDQNTDVCERGQSDSGTAPEGNPHILHSGTIHITAFSQAPQLHPSPYNFRAPRTVLGRDSTSGIRSLRSIGTEGPNSSPLDHFPLNFDGPLQHPLHPLVAPTRIEGASTPFFPSATLSTQNGTGFSPQLPGIPSFAGPARNMSLPALPNFGPRGTTPSTSYLFPPPYHHPISAPLPPKGLYTVPTKPKASTSPPKDLALIEPNSNRPSIAINRLIITGKNGTTLVDHRWSTAQRVAVSLDALSVEHSDRRPVKIGEESPGSAENAELLTEPCPRTKRNVKMSTPPLSSSLEMAHTRPIRTRQKDAAHQEQIKKNPLGATVVDCAPKSALGKQRSSKKQNTIVGAIELSTETTPVAQHRPIPSGSVPGDQDPKTTTVWLEDPEEVLRKAARLRRSRSRTKRNTDSEVVSRPKMSARVGNGMIVSDTMTSSPLSSVPSTPEPEGEHVSNNVPTGAATISPPRTKVVQVASSPGQNMSPTPRRDSQSHSPSKLPSTVTPRLKAQAPITPKSSPSPNTKKRKAAGRYLAKQPRSPDRLKTVGNPPLNRDCVIAYAESEDKDSERGVLRQVKGERQGVFQEEYVVFATRFFIAGD